MKQYSRNTATCTICGQMFTGPRSSRILEARGLEPAAQFGAQLAQHVFKQHPEVGEQLELSTLHYRGYLVMAYWETSDPLVTSSREQMRQWLQTSTRKLSVPDSELIERAAGLAEEIDCALYLNADGNPAIKPEVRGIIEEHLRALRAALVEPPPDLQMLTTAARA